MKEELSRISRIIEQERNSTLYHLAKFITEDLNIPFKQEEDTFYLTRGGLHIFYKTILTTKHSEEELNLNRNHSDDSLDYEEFLITNSNNPRIKYLTFDVQHFRDTFSGIHEYPSRNNFFNELRRELEHRLRNPQQNDGIGFEKQLPYFDIESVKDIFLYVYKRFKEA